MSLLEFLNGCQLSGGNIVVATPPIIVTAPFANTTGISSLSKFKYSLPLGNTNIPLAGTCSVPVKSSAGIM